MQSRMVIHSGADSASVLLRPARWLRANCWALAGLGLLVEVIATGLIFVQAWTPVTVLGLSGLLAIMAGRTIARSQVRCTDAGIRLTLLGSRFIPAADIGSLRVQPVSGLGRLDRALIAVVVENGSVLRLDPTLVVRSAPDHEQLNSWLDAMNAVLQLAGDQEKRNSERFAYLQEVQRDPADRDGQPERGEPK